jgi:ribosomal protein S18 acetylase RimI-like enzyme
VTTPPVAPGLDDPAVRALLDDIFWQAMSGAQQRFTEGNAVARRYAHGFSPIVAFADREHPDFSALAPVCDVGERFYCDTWSGPPQPGWEIAVEATMLRMVWDAPMPDADPAQDAVALQPSHAGQALALATLTNPGPFGPRTPELGEYFGLFEGASLIAMAGERLEAGPLREVSGICTYPASQGRGLARRLTTKLVRRQLQRGLRPFLHVMAKNTGARALYEKLGFVVYRETVVRVVERVA